MPPNVRQLRQSVDDVATLAARELDRVWRAAPEAVVAREALLDTLPALTATHGAAAATVAADWYDETRAGLNVPRRFSAITAAPVIGGTDALARVAVGPLFSANPDLAAARTLAAGGLQRHIANAARDTIRASSIADPSARGWMRVTSGGCAFCEMLAGRGAVYTEATVDFAAHDHCRCSAVPVFEDRDQPDTHLPDETAADVEQPAELDAPPNAPPPRVTSKAAREAAQLDDVAARHGVTPDDITASRTQMRALRKRVADEAARDQYEALGILERSEAVRIRRPSSARTAGGEYDWLERIGPGERSRLSRKYYDDAATNSVDLVAGRLRDDLGGALVDMTDDEIMEKVWLPLNRRVDAAGALRRGKLPSARAYNGAIDIDQFAPGVKGDGYDIVQLLGDDLDAAGHVAQVNQTAYADEAYRALGRSTTPTHGPAPFEMSFQSWETEVRTLEAGIDGLEDLPMTLPEARARLAELVPEQMDGPGFSYEDLYGATVTTARQAGLPVPDYAVIPW